MTTRQACGRSPRLLLALCAVVACAQALAQTRPALEQIGVAGPSVPVAPYLGHLLSGQDQPGVIPGVRFPLRSRLTGAALTDTAPSVAVFPSSWMVQPMFVLGADAISRAWLQSHRAQLVATGAAGIVVAAGSERDFKALQSLTPELTLVPATGPWLEQTLIEAGIRHYPLWIDGQGRVQSSPARNTP